MGGHVAVVQFPGTNCEMDVVDALASLGVPAKVVFHDAESLTGAEAVVIAGGFAHGDYLRPGAIARFSPVMEPVRRMADAGAPVIGICNGFQVLCESMLLPGALQKNAGLRFRCEMVDLRVESVDSPLTSRCSVGDELRIPINHFEGSYICSRETLEELTAHDRVILRYVDNPNGSMDDIAGICSAGRNVVGLMPHPERASHELLGSVDGVAMFESMLSWSGALV